MTRKCEQLWPSNMSTERKVPWQAAPHLGYWHEMLEIHLSIWERNGPCPREAAHYSLAESSKLTCHERAPSRRTSRRWFCHTSEVVTGRTFGCTKQNICAILLEVRNSMTRRRCTDGSLVEDRPLAAVRRDDRHARKRPARLSQHALEWTPLERPLRPGIRPGIRGVLVYHVSYALLARLVSLGLPGGGICSPGSLYLG